ncbi:potassium-transporting ATPase subunit C [Escherichia coli]
MAVKNPKLDKTIAARVAALRAANPDASTNVPVELVTASASGLEIPPPRKRRSANPTRGESAWLSVEQLTQLIARNSQQPLGYIS